MFNIALALVLSRNNDRQTMFLAKPVGGAADIVIRHRVIVHRLFEVDSIENLDVVVVLQKGIATFDDNTALRVVPVKIENRSVT